MTMTSALTLLLGVLLGALVGSLIARNREAWARTDLTARATAAEERARAAEQRADLVGGQLAERLQALSVQAVDASTRRFLEMAEGRLGTANAKATGELETRRAAVENLIGPLKETLARVETQLRESDAQRRASHAALTEQVSIARQSSDELRLQTQALVTALRRPEARGRWGEMQLRRVVELAGMSARCDFDEQVTVASADGPLRPDMVVRLAGGKNIVVDSKVSLAAYLEAAESPDEAIRDARLGAHARHLREHVDRLAAKAYWAAVSPAPEFVVLFIPGEAFLAPALERDPGLLEYAVSRRVHIATPTTLVSMLRTAQYAWQQAALSDNARAVFELGRELYDRLGGMGQHVDRLGRALTSAVKTYNQAVGSLESRVLVSARRLNQIGLVDAALETPELIEESTRLLSAPELTSELPAELGTDVPAEAGTDLPAEPGTDLPAEPGTDLPAEPGTGRPAGAGAGHAAAPGTGRPAAPGTERPAHLTRDLPAGLASARAPHSRRPAKAMAAHHNGAAK
jgi:DNA recombination protein RmuC